MFSCPKCWESMEMCRCSIDIKEDLFKESTYAKLSVAELTRVEDIIRNLKKEATRTEVKAELTSEQTTELLGLSKLTEVLVFAEKHNLKFVPPTLENGGLVEDGDHFIISFKNCFVKFK